MWRRGDRATARRRRWAPPEGLRSRGESKQNNDRRLDGWEAIENRLLDFAVKGFREPSENQNRWSPKGEAPGFFPRWRVE